MSYQKFLELYEAYCLEQLRLEPRERGMRFWFDQQKMVIDEMRHFAKSKGLTTDVPEPTPLDIPLDAVMAKHVPINALWDAIGVYCEAVIDDELAACGIGEKVDPRMRIGAAKRLIGLIGDRTDHDAPAYPANRLHKDAHRTPTPPAEEGGKS